MSSSEKLTPVKVTYPDRVYWFNRGLYLTYWTEYERWINQHVNNKLWEIMRQWFVFAAFRPDMKWFDYYDSYYDGHTIKYLAFFGFQIGFGYSYESSQIEEGTVNG